jgi:predicted DNA-binding transcriptional regulator AlpA
MADYLYEGSGKTSEILKSKNFPNLPLCETPGVWSRQTIEQVLAVTTTSELLTVQGAADFLGVHRSFLDRRRVLGGGPRYIRLSARVIRYAPDDLDTWLADRRQANTSDTYNQ